MLTKSELIDELVARGAGERRHVNNMLKHLADVAQEQVAAGNDFTVPGIVRVVWNYRAPKKKGERWKKGDMVQGFGGSSEVKDSDSPPITAKARLVASPTGAVGRLKPKADDATQKDFLKSKAGKNIATRKS
jgi:nucleoid DNA-binding protein